MRANVGKLSTAIYSIAGRLPYLRTSALYVLPFQRYWPKYRKKCPSDPLDIILVFDKVEGVECESKVKTGTGSSFGRHFGQKPIFWHFLAFYNPVAMGRTWSILGVVSYVSALNICAKGQGHRSRSSYLSHWGPCLANRREMPCLATNISASELAISGPFAVFDTSLVVLKDWRVSSLQLFPF